MDEIEEQDERAQKFQAAISALEPYVSVSADKIALGDVDPALLGIDSDTFGTLMASVESANEQIASGQIALNDLQLQTEEFGLG